MKNIFWQFIIILFLGAVTTACMEKNLDFHDNPSSGNSVEDMNVPKDFDWRTTQDVALNISLDLPELFKGYQKISVYNGHPDQGGSLIISGAISRDKPYQVSLNIPSYLKDVYLLRTVADQQNEIVNVEIVNGRIDYAFTAKKSVPLFKETVSGPDCSSGCDVPITSNGNYTIKDGLTYCISGNFSGKISWQAWSGGGTLIICGSANITQNTTLGTDCHIIVAEGGSLIMGNNGNKDIVLDYGDASLVVYEGATLNVRKLEINTAGNSFVNYSENVTVSNDFQNNGSFTNHGTIDFGGDLDNNEEMTNYGIINVDDHMEINDYFVNNSKIYVDKKIYFNGSSTCQNNCVITSGDHVEINNSNFEMNSAYFYSDKKLLIWANVSLNDGSMMEADEDFELSQTMTGTGATSSVVNHDVTKIWGTVSGNIEMADEDGELEGGSMSDFINGATFVDIDDIENYIPVSECNPEGIGEPGFQDADGDGVADEDDDYPNDATRAFNNFYPSNTAWGSVAFEDLWPSSGDYDFNDLVLNYQVKEVTNASNNVVELFMSMKVEAIGAGLINGFGIQFDNLTPSQLGTVSGLSLEDGYISLNGNNTESSQAKAVIIPLDNVRNIVNVTSPGSGFNTTPGAGGGWSDTLVVHVPFVNPLAQANVGTPPYNPFLIKNQQRGMEIHLPDYVPTSLANTGIFGTFEDASVPASGIYYVTENNLPWAIQLSEPFDWPIERTEIVEGYTHFAQWAQSGGTSFPDWYKNLSGYRVANKIWD